MVTQADREQRISGAFVALADTLVDDYDIIDLLDHSSPTAWRCWPPTPRGSCSPIPREQLHPVAASSEDAQTMELLQLQSEEGPCLLAYQSAAQVRIPDLSLVADRWPRFVAAVEQAGRSLQCTRSRCDCGAMPSVR